MQHGQVVIVNRDWFERVEDTEARSVGHDIYIYIGTLTSPHRMLSLTPSIISGPLNTFGDASGDC